MRQRREFLADLDPTLRRDSVEVSVGMDPPPGTCLRPEKIHLLEVSRLIDDQMSRANMWNRYLVLRGAFHRFQALLTKLEYRMYQMTIHHSKTTPRPLISRPKATGRVDETSRAASVATVPDRGLAVPNGRSGAAQSPEHRLEAVADRVRKILRDEFPGARFADLAVQLDHESPD